MKQMQTHTHAHAHTLLGYLIGLSGVCHGGSPVGLDNVVGLMSAWLLICPPGHGGFRALHGLWVVQVRITTIQREDNEHWYDLYGCFSPKVPGMLTFRELFIIILLACVKVCSVIDDEIKRLNLLMYQKWDFLKYCFLMDKCKSYQPHKALSEDGLIGSSWIGLLKSNLYCSVDIDPTRAIDHHQLTVHTADEFYFSFWGYVAS